MAEKSIWDEWQATEARIESLQRELKEATQLAKEQREEILQRVNDRRLGVQVTRREGEVLEAFYGPPMQTNKEIAAKLNIAERSVKFHFSNLLLKYGVTDRHQLYMEVFKFRERKRT